MGARLGGLGLLLLAPVGILVGQDDRAADPVRFTADFSFVDTGGNTDLVTVSVAEKLEYDPSSRVGLRHSLGWVYGQTDGEETANQFQSGLRGTYRFGERLSVYAGVNYDYDLYAGIKRRFEELAGLGLTVVATDRHSLRIEAGTSFLQETTTEDLASDFLAGRGAVAYRWQFGEKAYLQQDLEYLANFADGRDYRLNTETTLVAPLNSILALKASYTIRNRGRPPEGFEHSDTVLRTGIQVAL